MQTSKHLELPFIHAPETHVKSHRRDEQDTRQARIQDDEMGVLCERREGHGEQGADSGHGGRQEEESKGDAGGGAEVDAFAS